MPASKKSGLYANIQAKRERIAHGSGEHMRKPGEEGAPAGDAFEKAEKTSAASKEKTAAGKASAKKASAKRAPARTAPAAKKAAQAAPKKVAASATKRIAASKAPARKSSAAKKRSGARKAVKAKDAG